MAALLASLGLGGGSGKTIPSATSDQEKTDLLLSKIVASSRASSPSSYFEKIASDVVATSPTFGKARVPAVAAHRDKESLMCEIIDLKKALEETEIHVKMHKQHYMRCLEESRRLEREVEELELRGNFDAPRTGGVVRLESRFRGLGAQVDLLEDIVAERKYGELAQLRKDLSATHTRETEVERDTVAGEISRLKIYLNHMKLLHDEAKEENESLKFCKRHLKRLSEENPKVQQAVENLNASIQKGREEIEKIKNECEDKESKMELWAQIDEKFDKRLEELTHKDHDMKAEKNKIERLNNQLGYDRMRFNQDFRKEHPGILLA